MGFDNLAGQLREAANKAAFTVFGGGKSSTAGWTRNKGKRKREARKADRAGAAEFASLSKFRRTLNIEPLEERIVPAVVSIAGGEYFAFEAPAGALGVIAFFADGTDAADARLTIDYTDNAGGTPDEINKISLDEDTDDGNTFAAWIGTNFGIDETSTGSLIFDDLAATLEADDSVDVTIATGVDFDPDETAANKELELAGGAGAVDFTLDTDISDGINVDDFDPAVLGSDVTKVDMDGSGATINIVESTVDGVIFAGVDIPAAGADAGDLVGASPGIEVSGDLGIPGVADDVAVDIAGALSGDVIAVNLFGDILVGGPITGDMSFSGDIGEAGFPVKIVSETSIDSTMTSVNIIEAVIRSAGDLDGEIAVEEKITDTTILAGHDGTEVDLDVSEAAFLGSFTAGSMLANIRAGTVDADGGIDPVTIAAAEDVGASDGSTDIVAAGDIEDLRIYAGAALDKPGNMYADILAGVESAEVGLIINQITGILDPTSVAVFDADGSISNLFIQADGNIGVDPAAAAGRDALDKATNIAAKGGTVGGIDPTILVADGTDVVPDGPTAHFNVLDLGDNAGASSQNFRADVIAGADTTPNAAAAIHHLRIYADGSVGVPGPDGDRPEGYTLIRSDTTIRDLLVDAGLGDGDSGGGDTEDMLMNVWAGLAGHTDGEHTVVRGLGDNFDTDEFEFNQIRADDNIGSDLLAQKDRDGILATGAVRDLVATAGTGAREGYAVGGTSFTIIGAGTGGAPTGPISDSGGSFFQNIAAGVLSDGAFDIDPTFVIADNNVGSEAGDNDIVADDDIIDLTVIAGFGVGESGNVTVDILAGIDSATVNGVISQTTGDPVDGLGAPFNDFEFDGSGEILDLFVRADGRIGAFPTAAVATNRAAADLASNIAASESIIDLTMIAEGDFGTTLGGFVYTSLGDDADGDDQDIFTDISAGADSDDDDITHVLTDVDMLADGGIGFDGIDGGSGGEDGFNYMRADGDIVTVRAVAGNNDDGDENENFHMNVFAGLEADATGNSRDDIDDPPGSNIVEGAIGFSDLLDVVVLAEDDIGLLEPVVEQDTDGFFAAGNITDLKLAAGSQAIFRMGEIAAVSGGFAGAAAFASDDGTRDEGGRMLLSVIAGVGYTSETNVAQIQRDGGDANIDPTDIFADNDVGQIPRGTNTIRAASDILDLRVFAGLKSDTVADDPGEDGAVYTDIIAGYTNNLGPLAPQPLERSFVGILAGPDGIAESTAAGLTDFQVKPVGTGPTDPGIDDDLEVVVNAGKEGILESVVIVSTIDDSVFMTSGKIDGLIVSADGDVDANIIAADDIRDANDSLGTIIAAGQELVVPGRPDTGFNEGDGGSVLGDIIAGADGTGVLGDGSQLAGGQFDVTIAADQDIGDLDEKDIITAFGLRNVTTGVPHPVTGTVTTFDIDTDGPKRQEDGGNGIDGIIVAGLAPRAFGDGNLYAPIDVDGTLNDHGVEFSLSPTYSAGGSAPNGGQVLNGIDPFQLSPVGVPFSPQGGDMLAIVAALENIDAFADITASSDIEEWILARFGDLNGDISAGVTSPYDVLFGVLGRGDIRGGTGADITAGGDIVGDIDAGSGGGGNIFTKIIAGFNQLAEGQTAFDPLGAAAKDLLPAGPVDFPTDDDPPFNFPKPGSFNINNYGSPTSTPDQFFNPLRYFSTSRPADTGVTGVEHTQLDFASGLTISGTLGASGGGDSSDVFVFVVDQPGTLIVDVDAEILGSGLTDPALEVYRHNPGVGTEFLGFPDVNGVTSVTAGEAPGALDPFGEWDLTLLNDAPTLFFLLIKDTGSAEFDPYTLNIEYTMIDPGASISPDDPEAGAILSGTSISADDDIGSGGDEAGAVSVSTDAVTGEDFITTDLGFDGEGRLTGDDIIRASESIQSRIVAGDDIFSAIVSGVNSEGNQGEAGDSIFLNVSDGPGDIDRLVFAGGNLAGDIVSGDDIGTQAFVNTMKFGSIIPGAGDGDRGAPTGNDTINIFATGASPGDILVDIIVVGDIGASGGGATPDVIIDAGSGTGGNIWGSGAPGTATNIIDVGGSIHDTIITADENIGDADGGVGVGDSIVAAGDIDPTSIEAGVFGSRFAATFVWSGDPVADALAALDVTPNLHGILLANVSAGGDINTVRIVTDGDIGDDDAEKQVIQAGDDIVDTLIRAGTGGGGSMYHDVRAGTDGSGSIDPTVIQADEDIGLTDGTTDIVAEDNIEDVSILAGVAAAFAGNMNADILAGVTGAVVGLAIDQVTGAVSAGTFDGSGKIENVVVRADGRVSVHPTAGTNARPATDTANNIAAADEIDGLAVIAEGAAIATGPFNSLIGPNLGGAGITGADAGGLVLNYGTYGDDGAAADQDVFVDINAGAGPGDDGVSLTELVIISEGGAGFETSEGFNTIRADRTVGSAVQTEGAIVVAGMGDSGGDQEEFQYNVLAGLNVDRTVVSEAGDIFNFRVYADDDIGSLDGAKDVDGFLASNDIDLLEAAAGTDAIAELIPAGAVGFFKGAASLDALSARDTGGSFLMNAEADDPDGTGRFGIDGGPSGGSEEFFSSGGGDSYIVASDDVGESAAEGRNTLRGSSGIFGLNVHAINGGIFTDVIAGSTDNDPTAATLVGGASIVETHLLAHTDVGRVGQATDGVVARGIGIGIDGIVFANGSIEDLTVSAETGDVLVNIVARTGSIETSSDGAPAEPSPGAVGPGGNPFFFDLNPGNAGTGRPEGTLVFAGDDVGDNGEGTNFIFAGTWIGLNNGGANTADLVVPAGFNVRVEGRSDVVTDVVADGGNINDTIIRAYDDIGTAGQDPDPSLATALGVIRADDDIKDTAIQAGEGTFGEAGDGGNILVNIIAGFDGTGSISDPVIIEADDNVGESPEGTNVIFAGTNIGAQDIDPNTAPVDNPDMSSAGARSSFDVFIDAGNSDSPGGSIYSDIIAGGSIVDTAITADDDIGSPGSSTLSGLSDVIDSDGLAIADNPNGIIQAGVNIGAGGTGNTGTVVIIAGDDLDGRNSSDDDGPNGDRILVDILARTGSIWDTLIAADDDAGEGESATPGFQTTFAPEGANVVMAGQNIGDGSAVNFGLSDATVSDVKSVVIQAGNLGDDNGNVFVDVMAIQGEINKLQVQAEDNVGAFGQLERDIVNGQVTTAVHSFNNGVSFTVGPDQLDSDGFTTAAGGGDDPHGIIQAGQHIIDLSVIAGEVSTGNTVKTGNETPGGSILVSVIAGGFPDIDPHITGLDMIADDDLGDPGRTDASTATFGRQGNIVTAPDGVSANNLIAGNNLDTFGNDIDNTEAGFGGTAIDSNGDLSIDIIAGSMLMVPDGFSIPSPVDSGLPFAFNINDGDDPTNPQNSFIPTLGSGGTPPGWLGGAIRGMAPGDDDIHINFLAVSEGGIFVPNDPATPLVTTPDDPGANEGNGNFNGTFVAADDLTIEEGIVNGHFLGDDGAIGRTLVAGASSPSGGSDVGAMDIDLTVVGTFYGPLAAGLFVPFDTNGATIGPNVGPFQAGTVITLGEIRGSLTAGRIDGSANGVSGVNGITLDEVLSGAEGLADQSYLGATTFSATTDIFLDIAAVGQPFIPPQGAPGAEVPNLGDGDIVNLSMIAFNELGSGGNDIVAEDAIHLNFILANVDAITAIDTDGSPGGDPSAPSTLLPLNNGVAGDLGADIIAYGHGNGAEGAPLSLGITDPDGAPNGISGGPIGAGFDPFVLIDSNAGGLPSNAPTGSVGQSPIVPVNAFGSRFGNAFGFGDIEGNIYALDNDPTDGLEQGDITVTWIAAGQDIDGDIAAQDDIALVADWSVGALIPGVDIDIAAGLSSNELLAAFGTSSDGDEADLVPGGEIDGRIIAGDDITTTDQDGDDAGLIFIAAQGLGGHTDEGEINGNIVSGAEDQVDDVVFAPPVGNAPNDPLGGNGSNIHALIIASTDIDDEFLGGKAILAGDPFGDFQAFFAGIGGGGFSTETGAATGSFQGTIVSGAGIDMILDNSDVNSPYNLDNVLTTDGDVEGVHADTDIHFLDYVISSLGITFNGIIATDDIDDITAGWGDPGGTGIITGDITAGDDIGTIVASKRIGNNGDVIAAGGDIELIQAGDPTSAVTPVPTSAPFDIPLLDSVGSVLADIFTGGTLDAILAGGGKGDQLTDTDINNDGITGNLFLGEFTGQGDLEFGEAGQVFTLDFNEPDDANIVEIRDGEIAWGLDIIQAHGDSFDHVHGFTLSFNGTATTPTVDIDELVIADDLEDDIVLDQGGIGRLRIDDDAIDRLGAGESARDAFNTQVPNFPLDNGQAQILLQLFDGDLSRTPVSRAFNEDAATQPFLAPPDFQLAGMEDADILVRDSIGFGSAVGSNEPGVFIEGRMDFSDIRSILDSISDVFIGTEMEDSDLLAEAPGGTIGDVFIGDDMDNSDIIAHTRVGNPDTVMSVDLGTLLHRPEISFSAQDSNPATNDGDITIVDSMFDSLIEAISGDILDILVGVQPDAIGDPDLDGDLFDADGDGIINSEILAERHIGNIRVVHGDIADGTEIETDFGFFGNIGNIEVLRGNIENDVDIVADGSIQAIAVGVDPGPDGILGTADDDVVTLTAEDSHSIQNDVFIEAVTGGIGPITVANDVEDDVRFEASEGGFGPIRIYDDLRNDVTIVTALETGGGLAGLFVGSDIDGSSGGVDIDIAGAITELTQGFFTGAILVGGNILGEVSIQGASIGAGGNGVLVGTTGVGGIRPGTFSVGPDGKAHTPDDGPRRDVVIRARGADDVPGGSGSIGNIAVRDVIGAEPSGDDTEHAGEVFIISEDGSIEEVVAGQIGVPDDPDLVSGGQPVSVGEEGGQVEITARQFIGDVVALDDAPVGITNLSLRVTSPFGSIGDIIAHGDVRSPINFSVVRFDGRVGDIVSLNGSVVISDLIVGGPVGDIFASEDIILTDVGIEGGSLGLDGTIGIDDASLPDPGQQLTDVDALGRERPEGAPSDGVTSEIGNIFFDNVRVFGDVGPVTAFQTVDIFDSGVGGHVESIRSITRDILLTDSAFGSVGDITALRNVEFEQVNIDENLGNVRGVTGRVLFTGTTVGGDVGNITALSNVLFLGDELDPALGSPVEDIFERIGLATGGSIGNITSTAGKVVSAVHLGETELINLLANNFDVPFFALRAHESIGDITASGDIFGGFLAETGSIGDIVSFGGDIGGRIPIELSHFFGQILDDFFSDVFQEELIGDFEEILENLVADTLSLNTSNLLREELGLLFPTFFRAGTDIGDVVAVTGNVGKIFDSIKLTEQIDELSDLFNSLADVVQITGAAELFDFLNDSISAEDLTRITGGVLVTDVVEAVVDAIVQFANFFNDPIFTEFLVDAIPADIHAGQNVGDVYGSDNLHVNVTAEVGNIGNGNVAQVPGARGGVVAQTGELLADVRAGGNIFNVEAGLGNILDSTRISAGGNIGNFAQETGIVAGNFIEDDVVVAAQGTIGVVDARVIGWSDDTDGVVITRTTVVEDQTPGVWDGINDVLVPDDDNIFDFANDRFVLADINNDGVITMSPIIQQYIAPSTLGGNPFLFADGFIDASEALAILQFAGEQLPDDLLGSGQGDEDFLNDVVARIFTELRTIDVDDVIDVPDTVTETTETPGDSVLFILAEGDDPDGGYAIGRVRATQDITTDVFISASAGGIGLIDARAGVLGAHHDFGDGSNFSAIVGGAGNNLENAVITAATSIGTIHGGKSITNLDIDVESTTVIDLGRLSDGQDNDLDGKIDEPDEAFVISGGVGLVGYLNNGDAGIKSGGDINIDLHTGGDIGITFANGSINSVYDAIGTINTIFAKTDITGEFVAAQGSIEGMLSLTGDVVDVTLKAGNNVEFVEAQLGEILNLTLVAGGSFDHITAFGAITGTIFVSGQGGAITSTSGAPVSIEFGFTLVSGDTVDVGIRGVQTTFALAADAGDNPFAILRLKDNILNITIDDSTATTDFFVTTAGPNLIHINNFVVNGDLENFKDDTGDRADVSIGVAEVRGDIVSTFRVEGPIDTLTIQGDVLTGATVRLRDVEDLDLGRILANASVTLGDADSVSAGELAGELSLDDAGSVGVGVVVGTLRVDDANSVRVNDVIGTLTLGDVGIFNARNIFSSNVTADSLGTLNAVSIEGLVKVGVLDGHTFNINVGDVSGSVIVQGANIQVSVGDDADDIFNGGVVDSVDIQVIKVFSQPVQISTTLNVDDVNAPAMNGKDLELFIGGNLTGVVSVHSGDLILHVTDSILADAEIHVDDGAIILLDVNGDVLTTNVTADGGIGTIQVGGDIPGLQIVTLDDSSKTPEQESVQFTNDSGDLQTVSVDGSSSKLTTRVTIAFGLVTSVEVSGKGSLSFSSTVSGVNDTARIGNMVLNAGDKIKIKQLNIDGDLDSLVGLNSKAQLQSGQISGDVGEIKLGGNIQKLRIGGDLGVLNSLFGKVQLVDIDGSADTISAGKGLKKITVLGDVNILQTDPGKSINDVLVSGGINFITTGKVNRVTAGDFIDTIAASKFTNVSPAPETFIQT